MSGYRFETLQLHAGQELPDSATGARAVPIYATSSYVFENCAQAEGRFALREEGNIYSRLTNPTTQAFEKRLAALENGAAAVAFASGAAAVTAAILTIAGAGSHIVASASLYGGTYSLLRHTLAEQGVTASFITGPDPEAFRRAVQPDTKAFFIETLGNPGGSLLDIQALADVAHAAGVPLIVDNTFATPYLLRPLELGADVVVHSATKFIGGHGAALGGAVVDGGCFNWAQNDKFPGLAAPCAAYHGLVFTQAAGALAYSARLRAVWLRDTGAALSPFHSFLFLQGLETLSLRVQRHVENALQIVRYLAQCPYVEQVSHPSLATHPSHALYQKYFPRGGGSIFTFDVKGGAAAARAVIDRLRLFSLLANVADSKSLVIHPASTTHAQLEEAALANAGIRPGTIRLSVGTEHIDDLLADLDQALKGVYAL